MGKITLEFDSLEEAQDAQTAIDGWKWKHSMWELDQELRSTTKYGSSKIKDGQACEVERNIAERYREIIRSILDSQNLKFD